MKDNTLILENLIMGESRVLRKLAIFFYGAYHRKFRRAYTKVSKQPIKEKKMKEKNIEEFLKTGYLYPEHYDTDLKDKESKRKEGYDFF